MANIDEKDIKILKLLRDNGKLSSYQIADMLGYSRSSVQGKIKKMEKEGIISQYTIRINYDKIGRDKVNYLFVKIDNHKLRANNWKLETVADYLMQNFDQITHVSVVTGRADIICRVRVKDFKELNKIVNEVRKMDCVEDTETQVGMYTSWKPKAALNYKGDVPCLEHNHDKCGHT